MYKTKTTIKTFSVAILSLLIVVLVAVPVAQAAGEALTANQAAALKKELNEQNKETLQIEPMYRTKISSDVVTETPLTPSDNGDYLLTRNNTIGLDPIPWLAGYNEETTVIKFSGTTKPNASITLTIRSNPIIKIARANSIGEWEVILDLEEVPAGSHTVYLQSESQDVKSDEIEIAKFVVLSRDTISNTTWMTVIIIGMGIILLLIAINIQFLYERKKADQYDAPPIAKKKDDVAPVNDEIKEGITEAAQQAEQRQLPLQESKPEEK